MDFHEEVAFNRQKEIAYDTQRDEYETPISKYLDHDASPSYVHRENVGEHSKLLSINEPIEIVEEPLAKRRVAWCRDVLKDAEKHGAPVGSTREGKKPDIYVGYVALMSDICDS